jgi:hypothetical protein
MTKNKLEKLNRILDLIKSNTQDLEVISKDKDLGLIDTAIDNLLYSIVEYQKEFWNKGVEDYAE